jgi:hypothetical protein
MANAKITELEANTTPIHTDVGVLVDDPAGTPVTQKATLANLLKGGYARTTITTSATPTPTGDFWRNELQATALTDNATIAAPTGSAAEGNMLKIVLTASGGTRTVGYNAALEAGNITRTTSLPSGSTLTQIYSYLNGAWTCQFNDVTT